VSRHSSPGSSLVSHPRDIQGVFERDLRISWAAFGLSAAVVASVLARPVAADVLKAPDLSLQRTTDERENPNTAPPAAPQRGATGEWGGVRSRLEDKGLTFAGTLLVDGSHVLRGGIDTERTFVRYYLDLNATLDLEKAAGWKGATAFFDFASHHGADGSAKGAGDFISFDNIEDPQYVQVAQLWFQQVIDEKVRMKVGKIDALVDFSAMEHATYFLSSAALYAPAMFPMPTGAHDAAGGELFLEQKDGPYVGGGAFYDNRHNRVMVLEGHPEDGSMADGGTFLIGEAGLHYRFLELQGHAAVGGWYHSGGFGRINEAGSSARGAYGVYAFIDQTLWEEAEVAGHAAREIGGFLQAGWTDARDSAVDGSFTGGLSAKGFVPGRADDVVGALAAYVHLPQKTLREEREMAFELFYHCQLLPFVALKPDFQYIVSPTGTYPDAAVVTLRLQIDF
jgi:porin